MDWTELFFGDPNKPTTRRGGGSGSMVLADALRADTSEPWKKRPATIDVGGATPGPAQSWDAPSVDVGGATNAAWETQPPQGGVAPIPNIPQQAAPGQGLPRAVAAQRGGAQAQAPQEVDPYLAALTEMTARMNRPQKAMYTPEEIAQRRATNTRDYELGLLGMLSGNENFANAGGQVLKQALANRTPKVTERGTYDPETGQFAYSPEYLNERDQAAFDKLTSAHAAYLGTRAEKAENRAWQEQQNAENRAARMENARIMSGMNEPLVQVQDAQGNTIYVRRSQAAGQQAPGHAASEGERKAASLLQRLSFSRQQYQDAIKDDPSAVRPTSVGKAAGAVPGVGEELGNAVNSPARQRVEAAQLDMLDAALTLGTGAAYTKEQLKGYARSYFPQLNDDPKTIKDKEARLANVIRAAEIAAGRAGGAATAAAGGGAPQGAPAGAGAAPAGKGPVKRGNVTIVEEK